MLWVLGVAIGAFALVAVFAKLAQILSLRIGRIQVSDLVYIYHGTGETFTLAHHGYCFGFVSQTALICLNSGLAFLVTMAALDDWIYCNVRRVKNIGSGLDV